MNGDKIDLIIFNYRKSHVSSAAHYYLRNISSIRKVLIHDSVVTLIHAFVSCRLDYSKSLFSGMTT